MLLSSTSSLLKRSTKIQREHGINALIRIAPWIVTAHLNKDNSNEMIGDKVISEHVCIGDSQAKRGAASCREWVQKVIARHMNIKSNTPIKEIQSMIQIQFLENVGLYLPSTITPILASYAPLCCC